MRVFLTLPPYLEADFFDILSARNHTLCKHNVLDIKKKTSYIPSYINESVTSSLVQVKISTRSLDPTPISAYARRPPEYAFLLMRACASIYEKNVNILYIF